MNRFLQRSDRRLRGLLIALMVLAAGALYAGSAVGRLEGVVTFPGETPPPAMFANPQEPQCPRGIGQNHLMVDQTTLGLQNALVILEVPDADPAPVGRATLTSDQCRLTPRIQWVTAGTSLELRGSGPAHHHIHVIHGNQTLFEVDLPPEGQSVHRPLVDPGLYKVNCDRHLWERAWIYVSADRYVTITGPHGEFTLTDIPRGRYDLRIWHEGWQETDPDVAGRPEWTAMGQTKSVRVKADQTTSVVLDNLSALP